MIKAVPIALVDDLWPVVGPMLDEALKVHPFLTLSDLEWLVMNGRATLIIDATARIRCAVVVEICEYPSVRVANVVALGGLTGFMANGLHDLLDYCEQWSIARGCKTFGMLGRPGWTRFINQRGGQSLKLVQAWKPLGVPCQAAERKFLQTS